MRGFLTNQVRHHLRYVVEVNPEDGTLQTITQSEPVFSFVVSEAMQQSLEASKTTQGTLGANTLLDRAWDALVGLQGQGISSNPGDQGQLGPAALFIAAKDASPRLLPAAPFQPSNVFVSAAALFEQFVRHEWL